MDFPTRVGMARAGHPVAFVWGGFPHPRGDGPWAEVFEVTGLTISPPAWGWPVGGGGGEENLSDFPTRVGMARP